MRIADALTLVSAESKDFESGEEEEVETPYIGMNVSRQLRLTRMLDNLIIRILLALILGTVHSIYSHPSMVSGYTRRTWCTCERQKWADKLIMMRIHTYIHQQHLSKISSKSLVVSNIKYMSVHTRLIICHCTLEVGWQTHYEGTPLYHNWVRWLKRHLVLGGWPLDYCEILGWSRLVLYLVMSPNSHQSAV